MEQDFSILHSNAQIYRTRTQFKAPHYVLMTDITRRSPSIRISDLNLNQFHCLKRCILLTDISEILIATI